MSEPLTLPILSIEDLRQLETNLLEADKEAWILLSGKPLQEDRRFFFNQLRAVRELIAIREGSVILGDVPPGLAEQLRNEPGAICVVAMPPSELEARHARLRKAAGAVLAAKSREWEIGDMEKEFYDLEAALAETPPGGAEGA